MDIQGINLRRSDFEAMHPTTRLFNFDAEKMVYFGYGSEIINSQWTTWCACIGMLHLEAKEVRAVLDTQALHDRRLVKSIREHVESHISEVSVNDLFDKGWLTAMKCIQNNIDMLEAQDSTND